MGKKLFVGGLPWAVDDEELRDTFSEFGVVTDAKVITDRDSGRSRGFGFVSFATDAEATKAMREMDGSQMGNRTINVNEAQERAPRADGGGGRYEDRGGGGRYEDRGRRDDRNDRRR